MGRACRSIRSFVARPLVVPSSSSGVLGPSIGPQFSLLSGNWKTSRSSSDLSRLWLRFSSSHCWSLLHWRHLSVVRPASAGDRYLSGLRAGDCGLPLQRRIHSTGMVGRLSSPPSGVADGDVSVPLMLCASTGIYFRSILASSRLPWCGISVGLCRSSLASPSRCLSEYAPSFHRLVSPRCGCV